jgi:hypothetical protein
MDIETATAPTTPSPESMEEEIPRGEKRKRDEKEVETDENGQPKDKKKRVRRPVSTKIGFTFLQFDSRFPQDKIEELVKDLREQVTEAEIDTKIDVVEGERVVVKDTPEESKEKKRKWRRDYRQKPDVKAKIEKEAKSKAGKDKRKKYNSDPTVAQRKKLLNKRNKNILSRLATENKALYDIYVKESGIDDPSYSGNRNWVPRKYWNISKETPPTNPPPTPTEEKKEEQESDDETETSESELSTTVEEK